MKNTILKYTKSEVDDVIASDYFSKKISIYDFTKSHPNLFSSYRLMDDEKLENVSYQLYGTTDYWDMLLMLNDMNPLFDMPYNSDTIINSARSQLDTYFFYTYSHAPLSDVTRNPELIEEFTTKAETLNERFRYIIIVNPTSLAAFIKLLKDNKYI